MLSFFLTPKDIRESAIQKAVDGEYDWMCACGCVGRQGAAASSSARLSPTPEALACLPGLGDNNFAGDDVACEAPCFVLGREYMVR